LAVELVQAAGELEVCVSVLGGHLNDAFPDLAGGIQVRLAHVEMTEFSEEDSIDRVLRCRQYQEGNGLLNVLRP